MRNVARMSGAIGRALLRNIPTLRPSRDVSRADSGIAIARSQTEPRRTRHAIAVATGPWPRLAGTISGAADWTRIGRGICSEHPDGTPQRLRQA